MADHLDYASRWCEDTFNPEFAERGLEFLAWYEAMEAMFDELAARGFEMRRRETETSLRQRAWAAAKRYGVFVPWDENKKLT